MYDMFYSGHWQYIQKEQVKLLLKEQDKKYSELFKGQDNKYSELFKEQDKKYSELFKEQDKKYSELFKEQDKKLQLLQEEDKKLQLLQEEDKKLQLLVEQVKKLQLLVEEDKKLQLLKEEDKELQLLIEEDKKLQLLKEEDKKLLQQDKLLQLEEQVKNLQGRLAAAEGDVNAYDDIDWLNKEQNAKVSSILNNPSIKWTEALRKILGTVFGKELLAQSSCVGRRHATYKALDARKLDVVRGIYVYYLYCMYSIYTSGLIFNTYGSNKEITDSKINVIVNSSCTTARRSLKQAN